ncbi:DUF4233 domain-containing protein [uncultured Gulosibacter sp.]|uniref:DUF4233 domain-containing protein n=1 Tax=uncultured Gulosibacter sp. TaxID=1339167 RepID=UPI00288C1C8E|nr:DUF4233 domain-containing protein [uncultured Gulosibacter sp.]
MIEQLGSILVAFQVVSVFCAGMALFGLKALPPAVALGGTAGYIVLMFVAVYTLRHRWGKWFLLGLEIALMLLGFVHGSMWVVGGIFTALWLWCLKAGGDAERRRAQMNQAETELK